MREILFRGFHPCEDGDKTVYVEGKAVKGRWVEGFVFEYHEVGICIGAEPLSANDYGEIYRDCYDVVLPSTAGQYTGLTDKNGVKIFEGDIAKLDCFKVEVNWQLDAWCVSGGHLSGDGLWCYNENMEIIGNTHEEGKDERLD